ncbi:VWA containing CoxE family protein [Phormidium yuhuli AB48]|uniref:VWA containing CoxE family protein n=1 Tax=Phormidium yuhuli AB48 TaxID=2940671 RepID=A0ABY5AU19_9CYAN|nr:VWA containing CoxE family protein [Phormidium yuhuli]USR92719.1 VWA containing CoxE family protein [Phormidium yuhuli AB48]
MRQRQAHELIEALFRRVRQRFDLGMEEYLVALRTLEGGWGRGDEAELQEVLQLLWCKSDIDRAHLQTEWESVWDSIRNGRSQPAPALPVEEASPPPTDISSPPPPPSQTSQPDRPPQPDPTAAELAPYPLKAPPPDLPAPPDELTFLDSDYPITRRSMSYAWRYLRRDVPTGPATLLDVAATVDSAARQGFFLAPVYQRQRENQAQLLLLVDRNGSMMPFHHFTRDLVETARYESALNPERVHVFYFHNIPAASVYDNPYLTRPVPLRQILSRCDANTALLIVSDAGAARGYRERTRVRATVQVLQDIRHYTNALAWLNPMPSSRWSKTSAGILRHLVPMFPMTPEGLSEAIDTVRCQLGG